GLVNEVVERPYSGIRGDLLTATVLRHKRFDTGVLISTSPGTSMIALLAGIPQRIGFAHSVSRLLLTQAVPFKPPPSTLNNLKLMEVMGCLLVKRDYVGLVKADLSSRQDSKQLLRLAGIGDNDSYAVLAPGTSSGREIKRWSDAGFAQVASSLQTRYGLRSVIVGNTRGHRISEIGENVIDLTNKTSISSLTAIVEEARLLIGVDSGVLHLAAAVGTPVVALFGPTNPDVTGPQGDGHQVIYADLPCRPCMSDRCKLKRKCMEMIQVDEVVERAERILADVPSTNNSNGYLEK
ncbi:MAG: glycosyltransferase family 9 protein, partial [Armatimonadota bacterium]